MKKPIDPRERLIDRVVGRRIRLRRAELDLTQGALADHIGITYQQLQKCENGANRVSAGRLWRIAKFLNVPVSYFYEEIPLERGHASAEPSPAEAAAMNPFGARILRALVDIGDPELKKRLAGLIEELASSVKPKKGP